jgi:hypothetical protein
MFRLSSAEPMLRRPLPLLGNFLDQLIHPGRDAGRDAGRDKEVEHDPGRPFTPPPPQPSKAEREDDDDDGPSFPMDPALA